MTEVFGRPGLPTVRSLLPKGTADLLDQDEAFAAAIRIAEFSHSQPYLTATGRLYADLVATTDDDRPWDERLLIWAVRRLRTVSVTTMGKYISSVSTLILWDTGTRPSRSPMVVAFCRALRKLEGEHRTKATTPLTVELYCFLRDVLHPPFDAMLVLGWRRSGRIQDVLELREGGLWLGLINEAAVEAERILAQADMVPVVLEQPFDKAAWAGIFYATQIALEPCEVDILKPYLGTAPPASAPRHRPLMFPGQTTAAFTAALRRVLPVQFSSRSIRRGALQTLIGNGVPLHSCMLLSLHRSTDGILNYVEKPDVDTVRTMLQMQSFL